MGDYSDLGILATILSRHGDHRGEHLAALVTTCSDVVALRRFACACAHHALATTGVSNLELQEALAIAYALAAEPLPSSATERAQQAAETVAQELENRADAIMEAVEEDTEPPPAYHEAFCRARAADSVVRCFEPSPAYAANRGCYDAYYSTQDVDALIALAGEMLR